MKLLSIIIVIFALTSCKDEKHYKIAEPKKVVLKPKRTIRSITDSIFFALSNNPKTIHDSYSRNSTNFYWWNYDNSINKWSLYKSYYKNDTLKEKGIYLNGWSFGLWQKFDDQGQLISETDYSIPHRKARNLLKYHQLLESLECKADSILITAFGKGFCDLHLILNADRTFWYTENNAGSLYENPEAMPHNLIYRYSIVFNDTLISKPIEIEFNINDEFEPRFKYGAPKGEKFEFKIDYFTAANIAKVLRYGQTFHNTEFIQREVLRFVYSENSGKYFWEISNVPESILLVENGVKIIKGNGKTLSIDISSGQTKETKFEGYIIID